MKIMLAGASGAMGRALVPLLVRAGHDVVGMVQRPRSVEVVHALGAEPRTVDALDAAAVLRCFRETRPQVVIHQLTAIPPALDMRHFDRDFALTNLLRTEGTRNLLAAAVDVGATHFLAQSFVTMTGTDQKSRALALLALHGCVIQALYILPPLRIHRAAPFTGCPIVSLRSANVSFLEVARLWPDSSPASPYR